MPEIIENIPESVQIRVRCIQPPDPIAYRADFGLQAYVGKERWNLAGIREEDGSYRFETALKVRKRKGTDELDFAGDFVHGPAGGRFLYLHWSHYVEGGVPINRRMKITLTPITWEQISEATGKNGFLEVAVQGTGKDGNLNCATVALLGEGWTVHEN